MTRLCERCGRGALRGNSRSHSNIATIKRQSVNLQWKRMGGKLIRLCTRCIRTAKTKKS